MKKTTDTMLTIINNLKKDSIALSKFTEGERKLIRQLAAAKKVKLIKDGRKTFVAPLKSTPSKKSRHPSVNGNAKMTISSTAREMILKGKTNEQVLAALVDLFGLDPVSRRHYPGWYRSQLVRNGELSHAEARRTAHTNKG